MDRSRLNPDRHSARRHLKADSKDWTISDVNIQTADGSKLAVLALGATPPKEGTAFGEK